MNLSDLFVTMEKLAETTDPGLFPFPYGVHLMFSLCALVFFAYRFYTQKRPFQLIMAIAIPFSLTLWLSDNKTLFYSVGIIELVLVLAAVVTSFIFKAPSAENGDAEGENDSDNDDDDSSGDEDADSDDDGGDE